MYRGKLRVPTTSRLLSGIPDGEAGVRVTLGHMVALKKTYRTHPTIRALAMRIIRRCPSKDALCEARSIHEFVKRRVRYCHDIVDVETLQTPVVTLELGQGDCDDSSLLLAALAESVGIRARFVAMGFSSRRGFSHVMAELQVYGNWLAGECTEQWELGEQRATPIKRIVEG